MKHFTNTITAKILSIIILEVFCASLVFADIPSTPKPHLRAYLACNNEVGKERLKQGAEAVNTVMNGGVFEEGYPDSKNQTVLITPLDAGPRTDPFAPFALNVQGSGKPETAIGKLLAARYSQLTVKSVEPLKDADFVPGFTTTFRPFSVYTTEGKHLLVSELIRINPGEPDMSLKNARFFASFQQKLYESQSSGHPHLKNMPAIYPRTDIAAEDCLHPADQYLNVDKLGKFYFVVQDFVDGDFRSNEAWGLNEYRAVGRTSAAIAQETISPNTRNEFSHATYLRDLAESFDGNALEKKIDELQKMIRAMPEDSQASSHNQNFLKLKSGELKERFLRHRAMFLTSFTRERYGKVAIKSMHFDLKPGNVRFVTIEDVLYASAFDFNLVTPMIWTADIARAFFAADRADEIRPWDYGRFKAWNEGVTEVIKRPLTKEEIFTQWSALHLQVLKMIYDSLIDEQYPFNAFNHPNSVLPVLLYNFEALESFTQAPPEYLVKEIQSFAPKKSLQIVKPQIQQDEVKVFASNMFAEKIPEIVLGLKSKTAMAAPTVIPAVKVLDLALFHGSNGKFDGEVFKKALETMQKASTVNLEHIMQIIVVNTDESLAFDAAEQLQIYIDSGLITFLDQDQGEGETISDYCLEKYTTADEVEISIAYEGSNRNVFGPGKEEITYVEVETSDGVPHMNEILLGLFADELPNIRKEINQHFKNSSIHLT